MHRRRVPSGALAEIRNLRVYKRKPSRNEHLLPRMLRYYGGGGSLRENLFPEVLIGNSGARAASLCERDDRAERKNDFPMKLSDRVLESLSDKLLQVPALREISSFEESENCCAALESELYSSE